MSSLAAFLGGVASACVILMSHVCVATTFQYYECAMQKYFAGFCSCVSPQIRAVFRLWRFPKAAMSTSTKQQLAFKDSRRSVSSGVLLASHHYCWKFSGQCVHRPSALSTGSCTSQNS